MTNFWNLDDPEEGYKPWTLQDIYDDLGNVSEICEALDVNPLRYRQWLVRRERIRCPHPIKRISGVDIYSVQEWRDWFKQWMDPNRRTHGRHPQSAWVNAKTFTENQPFFTHGLKCPTCGRLSSDID